ncbi:MAG: NADPH-dependent F420 reductase [Gemmatimonadaceae bacterium]|nr:NADPH-dependent F420 reductase [Gloeobacterales cyanobacterium ES-bin-141]
MRIGIVGTGNMGRSLGILWAEQGHEVLFGARDADKGAQAAELAGHGAQGGTDDEAAQFGDVILYAIRGVEPSAVLSSTAVLDGKVVIDCNNREIPEGYAFGPLMEESLAEKLASQIPQARVVKAFNTFAQEVFELSPEPLKDHAVSVFLCSDDADAKQVVAGLAEQIGFVPTDCGPLRSARMVEALGDFIRFMIGGMKRGPYATISVHELPEATDRRLGGRQPGS